MDYNNFENERIRKRKQAEKIREIKKRRKRRWYFKLALRLFVPLIAIILVFVLIISGIVKAVNKKNDQLANASNVNDEAYEVEEVTPTPTPIPTDIQEPEPIVYSAESDENTGSLPAEVVSSYGILIDNDSRKILAQRSAKTRINPASMTKILTVLVAAENVENFDDTVTITLEYTDYSYSNDLSAVGFSENEVVSIWDLMYGTILPSGGDAAIALANYVAGSEEAFIQMLNDKIDQLGLSETTHFTNCVGIYDENHYSTVYDMAMIINAAIDNDICRKVMSAHTYTTSCTEQHPEGITISNWFLRRIEDKSVGKYVMCAKTGYVIQSGNCAASYAEDANGHGYICVTGNSSSSWRCIYDHVSIYETCIQSDESGNSSASDILDYEEDDSNFE